jgi:transcriptional regulator with XRE-family HTH domain
MTGPGSVVVRRQLGKQLAALREKSGKSLADVTSAGLGSKAKLSRIETGKQPVRVADIWALCRFYGADPATEARLAGLAPGTQDEGWWESYSAPNWFGLYVGLEQTADVIRAYDQNLPHGLLQTEEYARALLVGSGMSFSEEEVDKGVSFRMGRQAAVLGRTKPPELHFVIGPDVVQRRVGSREVLERQVAHMLDIIERGVATIQVLPWEAGAVPTQAPFTLMDFEDEEDPEIAYLEVPGGAKYIETSQELRYYRQSWSLLIERSIPLEEHVR